MPAVPIKSDVDGSVPDEIADLVGATLDEHGLKPMTPAIVTNVSGMGMYTVQIGFKGTLDLQEFLGYGDEDGQMLVRPEGEVTLVEITHEALTLKVFQPL